MLRAAVFAMLTGIFVLTLDAVSAQTSPTSEKILVAQAQTGQANRDSRRVRPQIRVTPRYPNRHYHSAYPVPYKYEYPGPNGVRHCVNRYVTERRPSGTVIVPRLRCWWEARR